jgi:uncharacterized membrane protein YgcG
MVNFIKRAAWRVMLDERRRRGQRPEVELSAIQSLSDAGAEGPDELAVEREAVAIGREALQMLSERDRLIFRQRHQLDLSPEEILQRTPDLSMRTYRKIIQRANNRVFSAFERIEGGERCEEMESSLLRRYVADECPESEQLEVEVHLAHCRACQMAHGRLRGYLLDVASGLAVVATAASSHRLGVLGLPARLLDALSNGASGAIEATRTARERVRDLIFRAASGIPGAGGDATVGQAVSATSVKVASACAAGVAAGACVAAGVVPGIGGIGLLEGHGHHRAPAPKTVSHVHHETAPPTLIDSLPEAEAPSAPPEKHEEKRPRKGGGAGEDHTGSSASAPSAAPSESASSSPSSAKESPKVTGGEFGAESGQPVTPPSTSSPPASSGSSGSSSSGSGSSSSGGGSSGASGGGEFGM